MDFAPISFTRPPMSFLVANSNAEPGMLTGAPPSPTGRGRTDPAALIAFAVRHHAMGAVDGTPIPADIRLGLRQHADQGHPGARATLDWLDKGLLRQLETMGAL